MSKESDLRAMREAQVKSRNRKPVHHMIPMEAPVTQPRKRMRKRRKR